jgi:hypothetical protein
MCDEIKNSEDGICARLGKDRRCKDSVSQFNECMYHSGCMNKKPWCFVKLNRSQSAGRSRQAKV